MVAMRKWILSLGGIGAIAVTSAGQTIPTAIANALRYYQYDDGTAETSYKIGFPSAAGESFSVDLDDDARGKLIMGVQIPTNVTSSGAMGIQSISVCPDNLALDPFGHTPDLSSPLTSLSNPTGQPAFGSGFCIANPTYDLPDVTAPTTGLHVCMSFATGDSGTWLCTDLGGARGRSYFTTNGYASVATPFSGNWMIRLATPHYSPDGGEFLINGSTNIALGGIDLMSLQFWSRDQSAPTFYLEVLDLGGVLVPVPGIVLQTALTNFQFNHIPALGELTGYVPCLALGSVVTFRAFFMDNLDLKKNGHPKIKLTGPATASLIYSKACCAQLCFGIADDGVMDGTVWKVQSPAGSKDWFNVHMGFLPPPGSPWSCPFSGPVTNLTGIEAVSWDFCGTGPCWAQVGIYPSNPVDPTGNTPDVSAPLTSVSGLSACMPPGSTGWGFPAVFYDTPDISADTVTDYHTAMQWSSQDSCTWMGADENTTSDDFITNCAGPFPSNTSFFTQDGYATNAIPMSFANWMERIDWN
jgi:hypothetical protein